jgi:hypothetical protein
LTVKFTFMVAAGGMHAGKLSLTVLTGWSAPSLTGSAAGFVTLGGAGSIAISGRVITISGLTQAAGTTVVITYGSRGSGGPGATAASTPGMQTWATKEQSVSNGTLTPLSTSPQIQVN